MRTVQDVTSNAAVEAPEWVRLVEQSVNSLHFGVVQIVVHNSKVVQIETTQKLRLDQPN